MNGFIAKTASGLCLCLGLSALGGCYHYRNLVDPCWPEHNNAIAARSVRDTHNAQAAKGHQLEQTVWNWHFEVDPKSGEPTERLSGAGIERLRTISRIQPMPDPQLWLQNAQDIPYDRAAPEKLIQQREHLNTRRILAIQRFLASQTNNPAVTFQIAVHDFAPTGIPANVISGTAEQKGVVGAYQKLENNFQGVPSGGGASSSTSSTTSSSTSGSSGSSGSGASGR